MSEEKTEQQDQPDKHTEQLNTPKTTDTAPTPASTKEPEPRTMDEEPIVDQHILSEIPPVIEETPAFIPPRPEEPNTPDEAHRQQQQALAEAEVKEVINFLHKYLKPAAIGLIAICIAILAVNFTKSNNAKKETLADTALLAAQSATEYQAILDQYSNTAAAPLALMSLAQLKFNTGDTITAERIYSEFGEKYPNHAMAAQAEFSRISCKEAMKQFDEAAKEYGEFKNTHQNSHLAPEALLGKARCLETTNKLPEAKQVYEDIVAFYPNTRWGQVAAVNMAVLNSKLK